MRTTIQLCAVLLIFGCSEVKQQPEKKYFPISTFLKAEIHTLRENKSALTKTIRQHNRSETRSVSTPDWENELKPFFEAAIDKPAWKNSYLCDTSGNDPNMVISYTTNNKKAPVKLMRISYLNNRVHTIFIRFEKSNAWFYLKQQLTFQSNAGYTIDSEQKMTLSAPTIYNISAKFGKYE